MKSVKNAASKVKNKVAKQVSSKLVYDNRKEYKRQYYQKNKDKIVLRHKEWRAKNMQQY